jgi:hypothetical protein
VQLLALLAAVALWCAPMPSLDHESLILLFRNQPELAAQLLRDALHLELPAYTEARLASSDLTEVVPTEFRADAVVLLVDGKPVLGVIVEVQLSRVDQKPFAWPAYASVLRSRHKCPVELLVLTHDRAVAAWAAKPIRLDLRGESVLRPLVLGPDGVPLVTDPEQAKRTPELAVLSALAHGGDEPELASKVGAAAIIAALGLDPERAALYSQLVDAALSTAARAALETLMETQSIPIKSEFARIQRASAQAEGILLVLEGRGLTVSAAQRERIVACSDLELLKVWLRRAGTVAVVDELFA